MRPKPYMGLGRSPLVQEGGFRLSERGGKKSSLWQRFRRINELASSLAAAREADVEFFRLVLLFSDVLRTRRVHARQLVIRFGVLALLVVVAACSDGAGPTAPSGRNRLAGGGRDQNDDPFAGGREGSGPAGPRAEPLPGYIPLFFSDTNCFPGTLQRVLRNKEDWQAWWTTAVSCLPHGDQLIDSPSPLPSSAPSPPPGSDPGGGADGSEPDSGRVEPDEPFDPYGPDAPEVDFGSYVVVTIGLESAAIWGRSVWVTEVVPGAGGSTVKFEVSRPGEDCIVLRGEPIDPGSLPPNSPTIAVLVPQPIDEPVTFERTDVTWNCTWEPDPDLPLTLYYTEAECDLGSGEAVITDAGAWEAWLNTAAACDITRWGDPGDSTVTIGSGEGVPGKPPPDGRDSGADPSPPPAPTPWLGLEVDFSTHAVIVLRADPQRHWGGGIWLDSFDATASGTIIDYSVMEPSGQCPEVEGGESVRPTAAIRLPLPLNAPISYNRHVESIDCNWEPLPLLPTRPS